jgi:hypothetical protein
LPRVEASGVVSSSAARLAALVERGDALVIACHSGSKCDGLPSGTFALRS